MFAICFVFILFISRHQCFRVHNVNTIHATSLYLNNEKKAPKGFGKIKPTTEVKAPINLPPTTANKLENKSDSKVDEDFNYDDIILNTQMFRSVKARDEERLNEKIQLLKDEEELIATDPSVGAVPEIVANRMIGRIAWFFGVPVFGGLTVFVVAFFLSRKFDLIIPPTIIAYATQFPFVIGLMGITYGILSSSWDEVLFFSYF
jgi:hypothetical protein